MWLKLTCRANRLSHSRVAQTSSSMSASRAGASLLLDGPWVRRTLAPLCLALGREPDGLPGSGGGFHQLPDRFEQRVDILIVCFDRRGKEVATVNALLTVGFFHVRKNPQSGNH
jgi:hypothetical protein